MIDEVIENWQFSTIYVYNRPYLKLNNAKGTNFGLIFNPCKINIFQRLIGDR